MIHNSPGILLSYPRSGNHLVRFLLEFATGKPTNGCVDNPDDHPLCENIYPCNVHPLEHVRGSPYYFKHHWVSEIKQNQQNHQLGLPSKLIVILRNPIECIARHVGYFWLKDNITQHAVEWNNIVEFFVKFDGPKHLIYYEHLINNVRKHNAIIKLLSFVKADSDLQQNLINRLDDYIKLCRCGSNRFWCGSISEDQPYFHINKIDRLNEFREIIEKSTGQYKVI